MRLNNKKTYSLEMQKASNMHENSDVRINMLIQIHKYKKCQ